MGLKAKALGPAVWAQTLAPPLSRTGCVSVDTGLPVASRPHLPSEVTIARASWTAMIIRTLTQGRASSHPAHAATVCTWITGQDEGDGHRTGVGDETHRLVGLRQNMELYGTMGRGPLLITSSASTSFFPSAWLSRSTFPPTRTQGPRVRGVAQTHSTQVSPGDILLLPPLRSSWTRPGKGVQGSTWPHRRLAPIPASHR